MANNLDILLQSLMVQPTSNTQSSIILAAVLIEYVLPLTVESVSITYPALNNWGASPWGVMVWGS